MKFAGLVLVVAHTCNCYVARKRATASEQVMSPSLLDSIKFPPSPRTRRRIKEHFSLGMEEFGYPWSDDDEDFAEHPRKKAAKETNTSEVQKVK